MRRRSALPGLHPLKRFFHHGLRDFDTTAALFPSSRFLVDSMLSRVPFPSARTLVELGPGTGALTRSILRRMHPDGKLYAIELNAELLDLTAQRLADPRLVPVHGDASVVGDLVREHGGPAKVDAVISSLGLSLMESAERDSMMTQVRGLLGDRGVFVQYAYLHARWFAYSQARETWFRWYARPYLSGHFAQVKSHFVPANLPPAVVYSCRNG